MRPTPSIRTLAVATLLTVATCAMASAAPVDFDRDIQPILSSRCLRCHGAAGPEAGLDLTSPAKATAELGSGARAITPGDPDASELLARIIAPADEGRMPPIGDPLSPTEIETLRRWIAEGAAWPPHWAYRPLARPAVPPAQSPAESTWARTPIDLFILEGLRERGFFPSPPADKRTWLRRVSFDLTGLPPTPEDLAAFLADDSPKAVDTAADRLLASPHYGERWARHWMDVAHFAETHGHDQDRPRPNAWPYRDYLIRSLNEDKPYARFVEEQVAGDILFPDDPHALAATGFLAAGPWDESSLMGVREDSIDREIGRYLDRDDILSSVMGTFTSSTVACARCHDHKFDPISQSEYYALQAVFAGVDKADRPYDPDPQIAHRRRDLLARKAALPVQRESADPALLIPAVQARVASWERDLDSAASTWITLDPESAASQNGSTLTELPDHSLIASGTRPETDVYTVTARVPLPAVTGLRIELLPDDSLPQKGPGRCDNGNLHLNELKITAAPAGDPSASTPIALRNPSADFDQAGWTLAMALDANPATAWGIFPEVGKPHRGTFELPEPLKLDGDTLLAFRLEQTHGGGHLIGRLRLAATAAPLPLPADVESLPAPVVAALAVPPEQRTDRQRAELAVHVLDRDITRELASLPPRQFLYTATNDFEPNGSFRPAAEPRPVFVLHRGDVRQPGPPAEPGALSLLSRRDQGGWGSMPQSVTVSAATAKGIPDGPSFVLTDPSDEGQRRAALARWLSDPQNVLTWRSIANRIWQHHFGRGLVDTPNDFGRMGSPPTHPELLDWLAVELLESGGSLKHLHRLIVTSATYRQSSRILSPPPPGEGQGGGERRSTPPIVPSLTTHHSPLNPHLTDADNLSLWRMNRTRLDAESTRDAILSITGLLDPKMGGPSVKQFIETPGIHVTPNVDYRTFDIDDPANHRRSAYRFLFRTLPDPFMETLDCPDGSQPTPQRAQSVTALQALAMLNNRFIVRQSERLAERLERERPDLRTRIHRLYDLTLLRPPTPDELDAFTTYATTHGLPNACRMLLNSNEFLFVD